jgi:uncharacterized membrane protein
MYTLFMAFSEDFFVRIIIFVLGLCGFMVARHIYKHKNNAESPLVCPIGFDCDFVVHSNYSEFMHVPLEVFGMIYYALLSLFYLGLILAPGYMPGALTILLLPATFCAFLFSIYLASVQIFILKKGCSWCLISTLISALIFILTIFNGM